MIGAAQKALLDEEQRNKLAFLLNHAKGGWGLLASQPAALLCGARACLQAGALSASGMSGSSGPQDCLLRIFVFRVQRR